MDLSSIVKTINPKQAILLLFKEDPGLVLPQLSLTAERLKTILHVVNVFGDQVDLGQVKTRISLSIEKVSVLRIFTNMCRVAHRPRNVLQWNLCNIMVNVYIALYLTLN